jgi:hypothetical protein
MNFYCRLKQHLLSPALNPQIRKPPEGGFSVSYYSELKSMKAEFSQNYLIKPHAILGPELPAGCDL